MMVDSAASPSQPSSEPHKAPTTAIAIVTPLFHPEPVGTAAYATDTALRLGRIGISPRVITNQPYYPAFRRFDGYGRGQRNDSLNGLPIYRLPTVVPRGGAAIWRAVSELNFLVQGLALRLRQRRLPSDLTISFSAGTPLVVLLGHFLTSRRGRHVSIIHDIQSGLAAALGMSGGRSLERLMKWMERYSLNKADMLVVLSPRMRDALVSLGITKPIEIIPLWPTISHLDEPIADYPRGSTGVEVQYSGNLGKKQGLDLMLAVAERLGHADEQIRIVVRGDGSQLERLKKEAARLNLTTLLFAPLVPQEQLHSALRAGDIHLVPQDPKTADFAVPSKVYNILAAGRPIITTALEGSSLHDLSLSCPAVIAVDPDSPDQLAKAVLALAHDPRRRSELGSLAAHYVREHHDPDAAAQALWGFLTR